MALGIISEISLESFEDVGVGAILGGVNNHIKALMLHPLKKIKGVCSLKALKFKQLQYTGENTDISACVESGMASLW